MSHPFFTLLAKRFLPAFIGRNFQCCAGPVCGGLPHQTAHARTRQEADRRFFCQEGGRTRPCRSSSVSFLRDGALAHPHRRHLNIEPALRTRLHLPDSRRTPVTLLANIGRGPAAVACPRRRPHASQAVAGAERDSAQPRQSLGRLATANHGYAVSRFV